MAIQSPAGVGSGPRPRVLAWAHHHRQAAAASVEKLIREPVSNALTVLVIAIALALPTFALTLANAVTQEINQLDAPPQLSVLTDPALTYGDAEVLAEKIERQPGVALVKIIDRDTALKEFINATGLDALSSRLASNPLPHTLWLYPSSNIRAAGLEQLSQDLTALPGVSEVILDSRWLERLEAFIALARSVAIALGVAMALGVVLTLGNTLRLGIESRREEIVVIKLIGGGNAFARRPFLYTGVLIGALGGLVAAVLILLALETLTVPISQLFELYDRSAAVSVFGLLNVFGLLAVGATLGWISACYSVQLHLARIQPR
jgi:cell division transport system permease protein